MQAYEYFLAMLNKAIDKAGSPSRLARALDIAPNMITRWSKGERFPNLKSIQPVFDYVNEEFRTGDAIVDKTVRFVTPRLVKAAEQLEEPDADDFLAAPVVGEVGAGPGYFDQNQAQFSSGNTVLEELWNEYPELDRFQVRSVLGAFLFTSDEVFKEVGDLSGGEKVRLSLAKLMLKKANLLKLNLMFID